MNLEETIRHRRSIYPDLFIEKDISKADLTSIVEAACYAPSHKKTNPWRFKILQGPAKERLGTFLASCYKESVLERKFSQYKSDKIQKKTTKSGAIIAICMQRDIKERVPEWEEIAATAMAVQNLWLTTTALGLGGYWSSPKFIDQMHLFFDLEAGERCLGFFYLGHYDNSLHPETPFRGTDNYTSWLTE